MGRHRRGAGPGSVGPTDSDPALHFERVPYGNTTPTNASVAKLRVNATTLRLDGYEPTGASSVTSRTTSILSTSACRLTPEGQPPGLQRPLRPQRLTKALAAAKRRAKA